MPLQFYWLNVNAGYDGDVYLTIVLNGFIHTVMYTYYFVSMHTKDIWWKKYLTLMQVRSCTGGGARDKSEVDAGHSSFFI